MGIYFWNRQEKMLTQEGFHEIVSYLSLRGINSFIPGKVTFSENICNYILVLDQY